MLKIRYISFSALLPQTIWAKIKFFICFRDQACIHRLFAILLLKNSKVILRYMFFSAYLPRSKNDKRCIVHFIRDSIKIQEY
jgi:hypothetical protein